MLLKAKPQDIAYRPTGLMSIVLFYVFSGIIVLGSTTESDVAIFSIVLDAAVLAIFSSACIYLLQYKARLVQTLAALFGTGIIFHLLAWPVIVQLNVSDLSDSSKSTLSLVFLMLLSWQILVYAHIYRSALSINMTKAVLLAIAYWLMSMTLSQLIF